MSQVNKDFYTMVVPRSMVSLRFMLNRTVEDDLFKNQLGRFVKVHKLNLENLNIYSPTVASNIAGSLKQNTHFCQRLEELEFRNIQFERPGLIITEELI